MKGEIIRVEGAVELDELLRAETDNGNQDQAHLSQSFWQPQHAIWGCMCALWNTYFDWLCMGKEMEQSGYDGLKESENQGGRPAKLSESDLKRWRRSWRRKTTGLPKRLEKHHGEIRCRSLRWYCSQNTKIWARIAVFQAISYRLS